MTKATAIMQQWDREAGIEPRTLEEYALDVAGGLGLWSWDEWITALENDDPAAILEGRRMWGLPPVR